MKKFVAFAVATLFTAGASIAMAQCPTCSGTAAPVFSSAQPVYSAPPVYSQPVYSAPIAAAPVYSAPVAAAPVYSEPIAAAPVYSEPIVSSAAPVYGAPASSCGCGTTGGEVVYGGGIVNGEATYTGGEFASYGNDTTLNVGSVINGETVISVGESTIVETTDPGEGSAESNVIDGSVEPSPDGGEVVSPPTEDTPAPEDATEGDA